MFQKKTPNLDSSNWDKSDFVYECLWITTVIMVRKILLIDTRPVKSDSAANTTLVMMKKMSKFLTTSSQFV